MKTNLLTVAVAGLMTLAPLAYADQHPDAQQRAALEKALTTAGYVSWGEIEMEHGFWDVDDARKELGSRQKFDLKVDPATMTVTEEKIDN
ncbi:MAG: PepSY domain-containing protein [Gammaproteobacteria bacterium]|nr:PepSY domain-containing protein [Gammaproteobacteria bacterium]